METEPLKIQEGQLHQWSKGFPYPPTPDIASAINRKWVEEADSKRLPRLRLAWVAVVVLLFLALMAVPSVRAQVLEFLQIGAIRILPPEPTPTVTQDQPQLIPSDGKSENLMVVTATPIPVYPSISDLAGKTTLEEARDELDFAIQLPTYPSDLGSPDRIFLQDFEGQAVLLIWLESGEPEHIRMNLLILGPGTFAQKGSPTLIDETTVNGQWAIWTEGSHFLHLGGNTYQTVTLVVEGNILIWEQDGLTYRLETALPLDEAVKVAESLK